MDVQIFTTSPEECREFFEKKLKFTTGPVEANYLASKGESLSIIDVRGVEDYAEGHIPGAKSLPEDKWESLEGLEKDKVNLVYCYSVVCHLAARASAFFASKGFSVMEIDGGFESWKEHELPIERGSAGGLKKTA